MAFTFKDFDKSFSKHKSEQTTENFIHQYRSPENSIASIELIDLEEEEKYIQNIRQQRIKIEQYKAENNKKDQTIKELEFEILSLQRNCETYKNMAGNFKALTEELKLKDSENKDLRTQIKTLTKDFEKSLARENEEKNNEIKSLKAKIKDLENSSNKQKKFEDNFRKFDENEIEDYKEKSWKSFEKQLKDQVSELSHEKSLLQEQVVNLKSFFEQHKLSFPSEFYLTPDKKKYLEIRQELENKEYELNLMKKNQEEYAVRTEYELKSLQHELDRSLMIISRQENSIVELRMRKTEDDMTISTLTYLLSNKEEQIYSLNSKIQKKYY